MNLANLTLIPLSFFAVGLSAQSTTFDHDDSKIETPTVSFPFYTPGGGATGATIRWQSFVPGNAKGLPTTAQYVARIGFQLGGKATYSRFEMRAGVNTLKALTLHLGDQPAGPADPVQRQRRRDPRWPRLPGQAGQQVGRVPARSPLRLESW